MTWLWLMSHRCTELGPAPDTASWRQLALAGMGAGRKLWGLPLVHSASEEMQYMLPDEVSLALFGPAGMIACSQELARL